MPRTRLAKTAVERSGEEPSDDAAQSLGRYRKRKRKSAPVHLDEQNVEEQKSRDSAGDEEGSEDGSGDDMSEGEDGSKEGSDVEDGSDEGDLREDVVKDEADGVKETNEDVKKKKKKKKATTMKPMTDEELKAYNDAQAKRGIIYMSWVPPYMKPMKIKHLLSQYGEIDRIFLAPEDPKSRKKRIKFGGNKKKKYTEGWVEFLDKKIAKRVAASLNGRIMGGKKSNYYHDDQWSLKYLPKFKWNHLTERIAYDNSVREQRLNAEMNQVRRETNMFLEQVTKSKEISAMEERHQEKGSHKEKRQRFNFKQRAPLK